MVTWQSAGRNAGTFIVNSSSIREIFKKTYLLTEENKHTSGNSFVHQFCSLT